MTHKMKFVPGTGVAPVGEAEEMIRGILDDEHLDDIRYAVFACMTKDGDIMSTGIGSRVVGIGLTEVLRDSLLKQIAGELGDDEEEEEEDV